MKVWTGHITTSKEESLFLGIFNSELSAADKVRSSRVNGFDKAGYVQEWDLEKEEMVDEVIVFDTCPNPII